MTTKTCKRCEQKLPISAFYVHREMHDGHLSFCKDCTRKRVALHRHRNIEHIREAERIRFHINPKRRAYQLRQSAQWAQQNPEKSAASRAVNNAVRDRRLLKPSACSQCGDTKRKLHAHHSDYTKKLDVEWLCAVCHSARHSAKEAV